MMNTIYNELNDALQEFNRLGIAEQFDFQKLYLYSIITHSTAIEGSTVTEIENTLMFDEGIVPGGHNVTEQMMNLDLKRAYDYVNGLLDNSRREQLSADLSLIADFDSGEAVVRFMRQKHDPFANYDLYKKALSMEEETCPLIVRRYMTTAQEHFIDCAFRILTKADVKYAEKLFENYPEIRNPYAQATACLLFGEHKMITLSREECGMAGNRAVVYTGPGKVEVQNIDFPELVLKDGPGVNFH